MNHIINIIVFALILFYHEASSTCDYQFTAERGQIKSPQYPSNYYNYLHCTFTIEAPSDKLVVLKFQDFDIEYSTDCRYDYVEIKEGNVWKKYCGTTPPPMHVSTGSRLKFLMRTDSTTTRRGFLANYWTIPKPPKPVEKCDFVLTDKQGNITFPGNFTTNDGVAVCKWKLVAEEGKVISLQFHHFNVRGDDECSNYYLFIVDGPSTSSTSWQKYCGKGNQPSYFSTSNVVYLMAKIKTGSASSGFSLTYTKFKQDRCRLTLGGVIGQFSSLGYPNHTVEYSECNWVMYGCTGKKGILTIEDFNISCDNGFLRIGEGVKFPGTQLGYLCGTGHAGKKFISKKGMNIDMSTTKFMQDQGALVSFNRCAAMDL